MEKKNLEIEKYVKRLILVTFSIIMISSMEAFILAKSSELIEAYIETNPGSIPGDYINVVLLNYFVRIIEPVIITLFTVFTYKKFGINRLYKFFFSAIIALKLFNLVIRFEFNSIFYYLLIALYLLLLVLVSTAPESKRKV